MLKGRVIVEDNIRWLVGKGSLNFWYYKWWSSHIIGDRLQVPASLQNLTVEEALTYPDKWENCCIGAYNVVDIKDIKSKKSLICDCRQVCLGSYYRWGIFYEVCLGYL